jgi:hypothetical protein
VAWLATAAADFDKIIAGPGVDQSWLDRLRASLAGGARELI